MGADVDYQAPDHQPSHAARGGTVTVNGLEMYYEPAALEGPGAAAGLIFHVVREGGPKSGELVDSRPQMQ